MLPPIPVSAYPPMLSSTSWPTAPVVGIPRFVSFPGDAVFVPQYTWGAPSEAEKKKKAAAKKKASRLRERAKKVEKKAGIKTAPTQAKKTTRLRPPGSLPNKSHSVPTSSQAAPEDLMPVPPGLEQASEDPGIAVPVGAEEGASNMKYIVGGSIFLLLGLGAAYLWQQQRKDKPEAAEESALTGPLSSLPASSDAPGE